MGKYLNSGTSHGTTGEPQTTLEQSQYSSHMKELESPISYDFPENQSQLSHIFRDRPGHLSDTPENRTLILNVANHPENYMGTDQFENKWFSQIQEDGSQIWVRTYEKVITNAGKNDPPRLWDSDTGFNQNPKHTSNWRKKK